jgi:hypothetical protein
MGCPRTKPPKQPKQPKQPDAEAAEAAAEAAEAAAVLFRLTVNDEGKCGGAIQTMNAVGYAELPSEKLGLLVAVFRAIAVAFPGVSGDELLPLIAYTISRSRLARKWSTLAYVQGLCDLSHASQVRRVPSVGAPYCATYRALLL